MKKYLIILFLFGWVIGNGQTLIDSQTTSTGWYQVSASFPIAAYQSFTCSGDYTLDSCKFSLFKNSTPTGNLYAKVYAHSGTYGSTSVATGSALATSDPISITTLGYSAALYNFVFSGANKINLSSNYYIIIIEYNGGDGTKILKVMHTSSSSAHGGNRGKTNDESTWTYLASGDLLFYVYGTPITTSTDTPLLEIFY